MGFHESHTLVGCGMVVLGMDPDELSSQLEQVTVIEYQKCQRRIAAELGHCLTGCDDDHRVDGVCKHTGEPCKHDEIAELVELFGQINRPKELSEA